jgi:hypothetical protein
VFFCTLLCVFFSCSNQEENQAAVIDDTMVELPAFTISRLDEDVFNFDTLHIKEYTQQLEYTYGKFYKTFIRSIVNNGDIKDSSYLMRIKAFVTDFDMKNAYAACQKNYSNISFLQNDFQSVFKKFKTIYPQKPLPKVVTMMSGFNYSAVNIDSTLAIGLEMYLGTNSEFYKMLALPLYKRKFMGKENIMPDAIRAWMLEEFKYDMSANDFLSQIVYMGKIMYLTDALLPQVSDTLKIQYSQQQMEYCVANEFNMWSYFVTQKMVYSTDQAKIMKYTVEGPFTTAFSKNSAPRVGYWMGWQIVKKYMSNNPQITIQQLMEEKNAQIILTKAKYKPKKS